MEELNNFPEHNKLLKHQKTQKQISNFLSFLFNNGLCLCELDETSHMFFKTYKSMDELICEYLGINYNKFLEEKELLYQYTKEE